jgi:hypothetical protein
VWKWILLGLVVLAVIAVVALRRRSAAPTRTGRPKPSAPPGRPAAKRQPAVKRPAATKPGGASTSATRARTPQSGEIWWADVPYEDGPGSKVRPCVVLRPCRGGFEVLKITSQDQSHRRDHVEIPTRTWDADATHNSYLDLSDPIKVNVELFEDRAGVLDAAVWKQVRALHAL